MHAAHVPHSASIGVGTKAADRYCIPLTYGCHIDTQHRIGWPEFARLYLGGDDPVALSDAYWKLWKGDKGELADGS